MITINDRSYSFENFLTDDSNLFAFKASIAVAENPVYYINPLLIYGEHGCGKTHLLYAIEDKIRTEHPGKTIVFTTAEEIVSLWIPVLKSKAYTDSLEVLCELYRSADVLLIDNFEDVAGKSATTDLMMKFIARRSAEYLQTVMVSSDSILSRRYIIDEFKVRFEDGILAKVEMAGRGLKKRFVSLVAEDLGVKLDGYIVKYLSRLDDTPPAELRGIVQKILLYCQINHAPPTIYWLERNIK